MKRSKANQRKILDLQEMEHSLARRRNAEIDLEELMLDIETKCARIRDQNAADLNELATGIKIETDMQIAYLKEHKADFDGPPRSIALASGTIGYRLGQTHLEPISKWTWAKVLANMLERGVMNFIRQVPEVDREQLLAQKDDFGADGLKAIGLKVAQDDKPFVEIKREDTDAVKQAAGGDAA